jgi:hypothetical protein
VSRTPAQDDGDLVIGITTAMNLILAAAAELETAARHARAAGHPQIAGQLESYTIGGLRRWAGSGYTCQIGNLPQMLTELTGDDRITAEGPP